MPPASKQPASAPVVPKPVAPSSSSSASSSSGGGVSYLSDEEKARLFAKYGKIEKPKAEDVAQVAGAGCKMQ